MTYCQKSDSDSNVQLIRNTGAGKENMACVDCSLLQGETFLLAGTQMQYPMTLHLNDHIFAGDKVPERVYDRLDREIHE